MVVLATLTGSSRIILCGLGNQKKLVPPGTLASRGLEEPAHASRGLEEPFFQLCCRISFWFWREKGFGLNMHVLLKVLVFCLAGCAVVSVFGSGGK